MNKYLILIIPILFSMCSRPTENTSESNANSNTPDKNIINISYKRSKCINYEEMPLTAKQKQLHGKAGFSGITDTQRRIGDEFEEKVLLYFKKGLQDYDCLLNDEIDDKELINSAKANDMHIIVTTDMKIAKVFDVPVIHLSQGGWELEYDYLFVIKKTNIHKVYKNICEEDILLLLRSVNSHFNLISIPALF
jgi:hypothetical protein